jgi:hypothetical protein
MQGRIRSACFASLVLAATVSAQSPLVTLSSATNEGNVGGAIYFDLQINTTVTLTRIDFLCGTLTVAGTGALDVYLGPTTYLNNLNGLAPWLLVGSAGNVPVAPSTMATGVLDTPFALGPGNYGVALKANNFNHRYANGTGTSVPGSGTNQTFATAEMVLRAGATQNTFLTGAIFTPRVFAGAIHYTLGGTPISTAAWEPFGSGCYSWYHSFYEMFDNPALGYDLGNNSGGTNSLTLSFMGGGYLVAPFNTHGAFFAPTAAATDLHLGNDAVATIALPWSMPYPAPGGARSTTQLEVCSNGFVSPAGTNGAGPIPSPAQFLIGEPRWCNWFDFDPASGGRVTSEVDPGGQSVYVTWEDVPDAGLPSSRNTWQLKFAHSGTVEFRWRRMGHALGGISPALVGWTPGGGVLDPGSSDLSLAAAFATGPTDHPALALALSARPRVGSSPNLVTENIPLGTPIGAVVLSTARYDPGLPLTGIRMPGCTQYVDLGAAATLLFFPTAASVNVTLPIPTNAAFSGLEFFAQSASCSSGYNALGVLSSQGVRLRLGMF